MNLKQSIARSYNLLAVSIIGLTGFAFLPEVGVEKDYPDKLDDLFLFVIGLGAMWWYSRSDNKYTRTLIPIVFIVTALVVKLIGLLIELDDPEAFGDDIGGIIMLVLATGIIIRQYQTTGRLLAEAK